MSSITADFEFEIGDLVYFKSAVHSFEHHPKLFCIFERAAVQCHGGIQQFYKVGGESGYQSETLLTRVEPEYRPRSEACTKERCEILTREQQVSRHGWRDSAEGNAADKTSEG